MRVCVLQTKQPPLSTYAKNVVPCVATVVYTSLWETDMVHVGLKLEASKAPFFMRREMVPFLGFLHLDN